MMTIIIIIIIIITRSLKNYTLWGFEKELTAKTFDCCGNANGRNYGIRNFITGF